MAKQDVPTVPTSTARWRVANPRGIPAGRHVLVTRVGDEDCYWGEGDDYDGPVTDRLVDLGFIVRVPEGN